ncbi:MAG: hypothetical protein R2761_27885 [Acidimicrobiales bacterium]
MALAQTIPNGVGARHRRAVGKAARDQRRVFGRQTSLARVLGWSGLGLLTLVWIQATAAALRVYALISSYEDVHGDSLDQWEGRAVRPPEFEQLRLSLEGIKEGSSVYLLFLMMFPLSLLALYGFWLGCAKWALGHRRVAWRSTFWVASAVVVVQAILLFPKIDSYNWITN